MAASATIIGYTKKNLDTLSFKSLSNLSFWTNWLDAFLLVRQQTGQRRVHPSSNYTFRQLQFSLVCVAIQTNQQQWDTRKRFDVSFIPSLDYVSAPSKVCSHFEIFSGEFHLGCSRFAIIDILWYYLQNTLRTKINGNLWVFGSAKQYQLSKHYCKSWASSTRVCSCGGLDESESDSIFLSCNSSKTIL